MTTCSLCHLEVAPEQSKTIPAGGHDLVVHSSCFEDFAALVTAASRVPGVPTAPTGLDLLIRTMGGQPVLVHRSFPNEQMPYLAYFAMQEEPVPVADVYQWGEQNEVHSSNASACIMRLRNKGLLSTFDKDGTRYAVITEDGRKAIEEYAASLTAKPE